MCSLQHIREFFFPRMEKLMALLHRAGVRVMTHSAGMNNLRILGCNGGCIPAPCHNLQSISPVENIVAMYETGYEEGFLNTRA